MTEPADNPAEAGQTWRPPRGREGNVASIVVGLVLLAVGIWYLLDHTLGIDMPRIDWGDLWPLILVVLGAAVLWQAVRRRA